MLDFFFCFFFLGGGIDFTPVIWGAFNSEGTNILLEQMIITIIIVYCLLVNSNINYNNRIWLKYLTMLITTVVFRLPMVFDSHKKRWNPSTDRFIMAQLLKVALFATIKEKFWITFSQLWNYIKGKTNTVILPKNIQFVSLISATYDFDKMSKNLHPFEQMALYLNVVMFP